MSAGSENALKVPRNERGTCFIGWGSWWGRINRALSQWVFFITTGGSLRVHKQQGFLTAPRLLPRYRFYTVVSLQIVVWLYSPQSFSGKELT